ncbi:MAG TPA: S46 family peptidase [Longimicrobiales bacterium]|nr:S46 family peptidase [Longimicrobiales bacterium]
MRPARPPFAAPAALGAALLLLPALAAGQVAAIDTIPGALDFGKMWTFEYPPADYITETYGFEATPEWFDRIRLSVLRVPGCSASFVSPHGLVATNHHCIRGRIPSVQRPGESILDDGFYAASLDEERRIPGYFADRLLAVEDVSDEVLAEVDRATTDGARREARARSARRIEERLRERHGTDVTVQIVPLYHGGRYSAYVFRRFTDVRLVAAAELQMGFFGGDPDNFTYPRYALDFAFLRVYDDQGLPFRTDHWLTWSVAGVEEGDAVFVVGNPGPTNRLLTMAQLELSRDVITPAMVRALADRLEAMRAFYRANHAVGEAMDLRNVMFSLSNSLKAYSGRLDALRTAEIMARKRNAERRFLRALAADPRLATRYGGAVDRVAALQADRRALAPMYGASRLLGSPTASSATLRRGLAAAAYLRAREAGVSGDSLAVLRRRITDVEDLPRVLEESLLALRLADFERYLGEAHPVTRRGLDGRTPPTAAGALLATSALATRAAAARAAEEGRLASDPVVVLARELLPLVEEFNRRWGALSDAESELAADLGRARFEVYGMTVPPDATSSPRITDGRVLPYEYNGTVAPVYTTFYGVYDHHHSYGPDSDWALPPRWLPPPQGLDLATPLNFISTADTYGGNSGSPAITPGVEMVGLNFDRNIEGLSRDFIYLPERGRNIMVDVRAITEALDDVYDADRLVEELLTGKLVRTEAEADEGVRE